LNTLSQTCIALCCSSALFLTGCQHFTQPQLPKNTQESENQFNGKVTLNSAKTGLITASSPEELLERATGWQAPITHIISWVQARPATTQAQTTQDSNGRINHIQEDGWNVDLSYDSEQKLPNKLILKQSLEDNKENRITMVIQNR